MPPADLQLCLSEFQLFESYTFFNRAYSSNNLKLKKLAETQLLRYYGLKAHISPQVEMLPITPFLEQTSGRHIRT